MNNPTPEKVQIVIDNLKLIEERANKRDAFDIEEARVSSCTHECGTVHCVAGWYVISQYEINKDIAFLIDNRNCDYDTGRELIANHLGFDHPHELQRWAAQNSDIWGNSDGRFMFSSKFAYNGLVYSKENPMTVVIKHWEGVKKQLEALRK